MVSQMSPSQIAPGKLEELRGLLNTWWIPNDTRELRDDLTMWLVENDAHDTPHEAIRVFRDELRRAIEDTSRMDAVCNEWISRYHIVPAISSRQVTFRGDRSLVTDLAVVVLEALRDQSLPRLKACPDCRWVFYDNTRNASKRWCMMNATTPGSRGCGNIAKARRHRARNRK